MRVKLLTYTPVPAEIVATAGRTCYSRFSPESIYQDMSWDKAVSYLPKFHGSCFEHISFTFAISGVSRACTHQLVRHRVGVAFSQQSQRYVDIHKTWRNIVIPPTVQSVLNDEDELYDCVDKEPLRAAYKEYMDGLMKFIGELDKHKIPSEDIRYFTPQGSTSNIVVTMNYRELKHFFGLRCCSRAQWEIRAMANEMLKQCKEQIPDLFTNVGAQCVQLGYCPEEKSCGRVPTLIQIKEEANGRSNKV